MINENQKPIHEYSEYTDYNKREFEIKGEIFPEPIRKTKNIELHVRISIFDDEGNPWGFTDDPMSKGRLYLEDMTTPTLVERVKYIKNNIDKFDVK